MSFNAGMRMRMWGNSYRFSKISDSLTVNRMVETYDVTTHETGGDKAFIAGLRTGGADWTGIYDASTAAAAQTVIAAGLGSTTPNVWTAAMEGDVVGKHALLWADRTKEIDISAPAANRIAVTYKGDATDHVLSGRVCIRGTVATAATGASASIDNGAATALGGRAHFHVTDTAAALGSITAKIQHSSAGASWADLLTFTTTSTGFAALDTTALPVKRFTRGIVTALSGASTVFLLAAFARKTA